MGRVGPPLTEFALRQYIAGILANVPENLVSWILHPPQYKSNTGMPDLGVRRQDAMDMVAYLYTLGPQDRVAALRRAAAVESAR